MSFSTNHFIIFCSVVHFSFLIAKGLLGLGFLKLQVKTVGQIGRRNTIKESLIFNSGGRLLALFPYLREAHSVSQGRHPAKTTKTGMRAPIQPSVAASRGGGGTDNNSQLPTIFLLPRHVSEPSRQLMISQWHLTAHGKLPVSRASNHQVSEEAAGAVSFCPH